MSKKNIQKKVAPKHAGRELSEEELESVTGGGIEKPTESTVAEENLLIVDKKETYVVPVAPRGKKKPRPAPDFGNA